MQNLSAVLRQADPQRAKPLIATEWGPATHTVGGRTYQHDVKSSCYSGTDDTMFLDAEARAPAYAARVLAYVLLLFNNGFDAALAWELADVSGIGKAGVGCFGLYDRVGQLKPSGAALMLLLRRLGRAPRSVERRWTDGEVVTGAFVSRVNGSEGGGGGGGALEVLTVAVANTGNGTATHSLRLLLPHGGHSRRAAVLRSVEGIHCDPRKVVTGHGTAPTLVEVHLKLPSQCLLVMTVAVDGDG
jgi:hypothetical protein